MIYISAPAALLALVALGAGPQPDRRPPGQAPGPPGRMTERLHRMTPSERQNVLSKLPEERRALVEQRLGKLDQLPPEALRRLGEEYSRFRQLPEEKQNEIRKLFRAFSELPEERRPRLRQELIDLRAMNPAGREARLDSEEFGSEYDERERGLLKQLLHALPEHSPATHTEAIPQDQDPKHERPESGR